MLSQTVSLSSIPTRYDELQFLNKLDYISNYARKRGYNLPQSSSDTLIRWRRLPENLQLKVFQGITMYEEILASVPHFENKVKPMPSGDEVTYISIALKKFGLTFRDSRFLETIEQGDIIEIYNSEGIQIYRNFEFFDKCSYSLLDLLSHEWNVLYERSQTMTDAILSRVYQVIQNSTGTEGFGIEDHTLREKFHPTGKIFRMRLKYISPLVLEGSTGRNVAEIHNLKAEVVLQEDSSQKIRYM
jgi:hypothetical protein